VLLLLSGLVRAEVEENEGREVHLFCRSAPKKALACIYSISNSLFCRVFGRFPSGKETYFRIKTNLSGSKGHHKKT
jgi:hypothetical protein